MRQNLEGFEVGLHRRRGEVTMRRSALVVLLAGACLVTVSSFITSAQVIDSDACEQACYEQESICVGACDTHTNPVECEARCHDERNEGLERCR
jgi:hypothetical protein